MKLISHKPKKCNVCGEKINEKNIINTNGYIRRKCKDCIRKQSKDINKHLKSMERNSPLLGMIQSPMKCWRGYERVPGTKEFSKGSCRKK